MRSSETVLCLLSAAGHFRNQVGLASDDNYMDITLKVKSGTLGEWEAQGKIGETIRLEGVQVDEKIA